MYKETITYTDFDGLERKEEFRFNLTKTEIFKMENETEGGLSNNLQRILDAKDVVKMAKFFDYILLASYGEKSDDGKTFLKSDEIREKFKCSVAYDIIYEKMVSDEEYAKTFLKAVFPDIPNQKK